MRAATSAGRATPADRRRGIVSVAIIVCLVVLTMICGALLKAGLVERRLIADQERRLQAEWLAESGLQRALARLATSADYAGETWEIAAQELGGTAPAVVRITVERPAAQPVRRRVRVEADYPSKSE